MTFLIDPSRPFSLQELKEYVKHLDDLFVDVDRLETLCKSEPSKSECLKLAGSEIGILYEQPFHENEMVAYGLPEIREHLPEVEQAENRYEKAWVLKEIPPPDFLKEGGSQAEKAKFYAYVYTAVKNARAIRIFGVPINYMVQLVREDRDIKHKAFMDAVRLDPAVISCPTFANKIAFEDLAGDLEFQRKLGNCFRSPKKLNATDDYGVLRYLLLLLDEASMLETMTVEEKYQLLCIDLEKYPDTGPDPARYLDQFIRRWKRYPAS